MGGVLLAPRGAFLSFLLTGSMRGGRKSPPPHLSKDGNGGRHTQYVSSPPFLCTPKGCVYERMCWDWGRGREYPRNGNRRVCTASVCEWLTDWHTHTATVHGTTYWTENNVKPSVCGPLDDAINSLWCKHIGVGINLETGPLKERRNPFLYTDAQLSKMCKFYIILWLFYHTSDSRIRKSMKAQGLCHGDGNPMAHGK
jgi:hypothetical protein